MLAFMIITALVILFILVKISKNSKPSNYERNLAEIKTMHSADEVLHMRTSAPNENSTQNKSYDPDAPYTPAGERQAFAIVETAIPVDIDIEPATGVGTTLNRGHKIDVVIKYQSERGEITVRKVRFAELQGTIHKDFSVSLISISGFCYLRSENRTFYFSGIKAAADPYTGKLIVHFPRFILRRFGRSNPIRMRNQRLN